MDTCIWSARGGDPAVCPNCVDADSYEPDEDELAKITPADAGDDEPQPKGGTDHGR